MKGIYEHFLQQFRKSPAARSSERRIGAELKFPLVNPDGTAVPREVVSDLWRHLAASGWKAVEDPVSGEVIGAKKPGEANDTVASCETGYVKTEFSLAHVPDLFALQREVELLRAELRRFSQARNVRFLGYGMQPVTPPSRALLLKKVRSSVWEKAVPSNACLAPEEGDDVYLFTINAGSHVHVSVDEEEAVQAVNVLTGFAGPQIALTAHSNVWRGRVDPTYKAVAEKLWDWWEPAQGRAGVPPEPFDDLEHYVGTIEQMRPIYVKREGRPVLLPAYASFAEYFGDDEAVGEDLEGHPVRLAPKAVDLDLHNSCYWYTARISRYFTVENRVYDQQPPDQLIAAAALTLGLVCASDEAWEELTAHAWSDLRAARDAACRDALAGRVCNTTLSALAGRMLEIAALGLRARGRGEEIFLQPLADRLQSGLCPADEVARLVSEGGIDALVAQRSL